MLVMGIANLVKYYNNTNLILRIIIGIIIGAVCAYIFPNFTWISVLGDLFVGALRAIAPFLVFILVIASLVKKVANQSSGLRVVIFLYLVSTILASVIAIVASFIFPQNLIFSTQSLNIQSVPQGIYSVVQNLLIKIVINPLESLSEGNYLGILFWAVISGLALRDLACDGTKNVLQDLSKGTLKIVYWIINFAPVGILGLVYSAFSTHGTGVFAAYGKLILLLLGCMIFVYFVANPIIVFLAIRQNPYPLIIKCLKGSAITAFFTRSSAANIPINMALCEKLELDPDMYSISIPLGATINMSGAAITISVMTLAAVSTLGIQVTFPMALILSVLSAFAACGASGIAGGSLLLIPMACSLFGIPNDIAIQVVGIGFIVGVIQDSLEKGETVSLSGLGSFRVKACKEKLGRNPKTGDTVPVPAGKKISFKPTVKLKKIIRK